MKTPKSQAAREGGSLRRLVRRIPLYNPGSQRCRCGRVLASHNQDLPWARCGNTACKHAHCDCEAFAPNEKLTDAAVSDAGKHK